MNFKQIIENNDTPQGRIFDLFIQFLILVSLVSFSVETLPNLSGQTIRILKYIEVITVSIFTLEYLSRIVVADRKFEFVFSFFGIIDFLAILPFYLPTGIDLRAVRILRLLRLFRAFKLLRYSLAIKRFHRALLIAKEELVLFTIVAVMVLYFASVGIYFFENSAQPEAFSSVFQSLWWALCTLTTVGYGDVYPVTAGGKIFTFFVLMVGLGVVAVPTGLVASALSSAREYEEENI
ncbi:ion transporter [Desulfopila sp. IMCC35008]|uniref:ion transporter n=1 Tax=Desulfopila sp. IMCC35008 TaxID=2653858 RepID=UPI0013D6D95F|nr:ion transporter [Desulfopila sp. IMCC35008]